MGFIHLQAHSGYSFMKSTLTIEKLVKGAKSKGFHAIALTDENVLHGAVQFYQTCKKYDIKPIIGLKVMVQTDDLTSTYPIIMLAENIKGYQHLLNLSSSIQFRDEQTAALQDIISQQNVTYILPVQHSPLKQFLISKHFDRAEQFLLNLKNTLPADHCYLGVEDHGTEEERKVNHLVLRMIQSIPVELAAIQDVRYLDEEDAFVYDCLQSIREGRRWHPNDLQVNVKHRHLATEEEMARKFQGEFEKALNNTAIIADRCEVELSFGRHLLPAFPVPEEGVTSDEYLEALCRKQAAKKYESPSQKVFERLEYELNVIKNMNFSDYFLIVWDFMQFARKVNILTGPGRGSAAGSLVAYLLDITEVDPLQYNLLFERFLNPERTSMPDIDIDFSDHRRDEVIQYVQKKYGEDRVAQIITFGTFAARSLLRELIKTMGVNQEDARFLLKEVPVNTSSLSNVLKESSELKKYVQQSPVLTTLFKIALKLEGLPRHHSTHAAGVVISDRPLTNYVPIMPGHQEISLTQYPMNDLEALGLLKMDFLGLRNLSLIERIIKHIRDQGNPSFSIKKIPLTDQKTFELLQNGKTTGVFQLESAGMRKVLKRLKPTEFEDIVAVNALYRPGPMDFIPDYIKRKHGLEDIQYLHEHLKPILRPTFGVLIYQEQIMQIANQIAGLTLGEADILRRAVGKKQKNLMDELQEKFINGCVNNGYEPALAEELFRWIIRFANYGFNRSHAVAYSMISYQLAYLKAHFPAYFFAELLSSVSHHQEKVRQYMKEAKEFSLDITPPSINHSYGKFTVEGDHKVRMALTVIKGVGKQAVEAIISARRNKPFKHLFDFCQRVPLRTVNRQVIESLILAGAFDETHKNRAELLASIDQAIEQGELFGDLASQGSLFEDELSLEVEYTRAEPFTELKQLSLEKEVLGMYVSSHPLANHRKELRKQGVLPLHKLKNHTGKVMPSVAVVQELKVIRTKRGEPMAFVTLADETDELEGVIFPDLFRQIKQWLEEEVIVSLKGKVEIRNEQAQIIIQEAVPFQFEQLKSSPEQGIYIKLLNADERRQISLLKKAAEQYPGEVPVIVYSPKRQGMYQLDESFYLKPARECLQKLKQSFGNDRVVMKKLNKE